MLTRPICAALAVVVCTVFSAFADFVAGPSNTIFPGAITPGYTDVATNGAIRWNPTTSRHQAFNGTNWVDVGTGAAGLQPTGFLPHAYIQSDATGGYGHVYGPRMPTNRSEALFLYATNALADMWPGQLMRNDMVGTVNEGNVYILSQPLYVTNFAPYTTNYFPWAGEPTATNYWNLFVERGRIGPQGLNGTDGADGIGNARISIWSAFYEYDYNTNSLHLVLDNGRLYLNTAASTNRQPSAVGGSNYWVVAVDKGMSGGLDPTNLVFRHEWDASSVYTNNDAVTYYGNLFYKGTGVTHFAAGVPPSINNATETVGVSTTNWTVLVSRGARGAMGPDGNVVKSFTYYYHYDIITTNSPTNTASSSHRLLAWVGTNAGGTNVYAWVDYLPVGTNVISVSGTNLLLNGAVFAPGGGVAPADAPTNYFVRLAGETNGVDLTNTTVKIRDAVSPNEPATLGQLQAGTAAAVTNAVAAAEVNGTDYVGLSKIKFVDPGIAGSAAGGTLTVSRVSTPIFLDAGNRPVYTNPVSGNPILLTTVPLTTPYGGVATGGFWRTYDTLDTWSNYNTGSWAYGVTNGVAFAHNVSNQVSTTVPRWDEMPFVSYINTNVRWRLSLRVKSHVAKGVQTTENNQFIFAAGQSPSGSWYGIRFAIANSAVLVYSATRGTNSVAAFGNLWQHITNSPPLNGNINGQALYLLGGPACAPFYLLIDYEPTNNVLRSGWAIDNGDGGIINPQIWQGSTNVPPLAHAAVFTQNNGVSYVPAYYEWDDMRLEGGLKWIP